MSTSRQQQHRQQENKNRAPEADALAVIPYVTADGERDTRMVELGPVWRSERGNLTFKLQLWPLQWDDPQHDRTIVIKMREAK